MTVWGERIAAAIAIVIALYMLSVGREFPAGGDQFPVFACFSIIAVALLMIVRTLASPAVFSGEAPRWLPFEDIKPLLLTAATVVYVLLIFRLGYYTSSLAFLVVISLVVGVRRFSTIAVTAVVVFPLMYAFFELFLNAQMPRGLII